MLTNPIYERERKKSARSSRFSIAFFLFNLLLTLVALFSMAITLHRVAETGELQYAVFLKIFCWIAWIEFAMVIVLMPARTAACISGEREKKTFDLLMSTCMRPMDIIIGDMLTAMSSVSLLLCSGGPVFAAVLLYGGVRLSELLLLAAVCILTAFFVGSIGLLFSACSANTTASMAMTYAAVVLLLFGPYALSLLAGGLSFASAQAGCLLPLSPLAVFHSALSLVTRETVLSEVFERTSPLGDREIFAVGVCLQLLLSVFFFVLSGRMISPGGPKNLRGKTPHESKI